MRLRVLIPLFAVLAALSVTGQVALRRARPPSAPALAEGAFAALGGLRSIAAEVVWFRMDRLQDEGRYVELAQLATVLTRVHRGGVQRGSIIRRLPQEPGQQAVNPSAHPAAATTCASCSHQLEVRCQHRA